MNHQYRFSFGPWNIHEGADPFGPDLRAPYPHERKFELYRELGFEGVQLHDDDVVPGLDELNAGQVLKRAASLGKLLGEQGLEAEFVAPRLWTSPRTADGAFTANSSRDRQYAADRLKQSVDIAREISAGAIVLWFAREGSYLREAKDAMNAYARLESAINTVLEYDTEIQVWIEPKPNEPMDQAYVPTVGHAIALSYASIDHSRVKGVVESAHAVLAGLDPSDELAFALAHDKLGSVHLNGQNGLKFDQDRPFGSVNVRTDFNQVWVLERSGYGRNGEFVGLDVKALRTQSGNPVTAHLSNSRELFLLLVEKVRSLDDSVVEQYRDTLDYEGLDRYVLRHLLGVEGDGE